ncbi:MAG: hypothetical protein ACI4XH_01795 [Acutalibacteraceae bacterium]
MKKEINSLDLEDSSINIDKAIALLQLACEEADAIPTKYIHNDQKTILELSIVADRSTILRTLLDTAFVILKNESKRLSELIY